MLYQIFFNVVKNLKKKIILLPLVAVVVVAVAVMVQKLIFCQLTQNMTLNCFVDLRILHINCPQIVPGDNFCTKYVSFYVNLQTICCQFLV